MDRLRADLKEVLAVPPDWDEEELPGWSVGPPLDTQEIANALSALQAKPGFQLVNYLFRDDSGRNGNGIVYAIPDGPLEEEVEWIRQSPVPGVSLDTPRPLKALASPLAAFRRPTNSLACLEASLVLHELQEFGALWHGVSWGVRTILGGDPFEGGSPLTRFSDGPLSREGWTWEGAEPTAWDPKVAVLPNGLTTVDFLVHDPVSPERIVRMQDRFSPDPRQPETQETVVARGRGGIYF